MRANARLLAVLMAASCATWVMRADGGDGGGGDGGNGDGADGGDRATNSRRGGRSSRSSGGDAGAGPEAVMATFRVRRAYDSDPDGDGIAVRVLELDPLPVAATGRGRSRRDAPHDATADFPTGIRIYLHDEDHALADAGEGERVGLVFGLVRLEGGDDGADRDRDGDGGRGGRDGGR
jgi:hypothetical protein